LRNLRQIVQDLALVGRSTNTVGSRGHALQAPEQPDLKRYLPQVAVATGWVLALPALAAAWLQASLGLHAVPSMLCAVLLSLVAANLGAAYWMRRPESRNLVFGDLMVWGWLRRMMAERRLAEATNLLGSNGLDDQRHVEVLTRLAASLEARDPYTYGHSKRVTRYSEMIADRMGLPEAQVAKIRTAAAVHDVGKINTPREILTKPGRLTDAEFSVIKRHAPEGAAMAAGIGDEDITAMVCHHHERLDGSGYPQGLAGDAVPLGARIIAVADVFDAMTSSRPYRPARPHKLALEILSEEAGTKLDARAVAAFRSCYSARRSVAWSALLVAAPQRLAAWAGGAASGGAAPLTTGLSALGAAALLGGSVTGPVALGEEEARRASEARESASPRADAADRARADRPSRGTAREAGGRAAPRSRLRPLPGRPGGGGGGDGYLGPRAGPTPVSPQSAPIPVATPPPQRPRPPRPPQPPQPPPVNPPALPQVELPGLKPPSLAPLPELDGLVDDLVDDRLVDDLVGGLSNRATRVP
jgi:putative nucleotidyltransferase with HDIG domain